MYVTWVLGNQKCTDLNVATVMKDAGVAEQASLEDSPPIQQIRHGVRILQHNSK